MASKGAIQAGEGYVKLGVQKSELQKGLEDAKKDIQSFARGVASIGAGVAAAGASIVGPMLYGLNQFAESGREVYKASRETGIGFETMGALAYALGGDISSAVGSIRKMDAFLQTVANGSAAASHTLSLLGVSFGDLNKASQHERLLLIADALDKISDAGQRAALKRSILGRGSGDINLSGGRAGIEAREARGRELGGVLSAADVQMAKDYNRSLKELNTVVGGIWKELGAAAAPYMTKFFQFVTEILIGVRQWLNSIRPTMAIIFAIADKVALIGAGLVAAAGVISVIGFGIGGISAALPVIIAIATGLLWVAGILAVVALVAWAVWEVLSAFPDLGASIASTFSSFGDYMSEWLPILQEFGDLFMSIWGGIVNAVSAGELGLAMDVAWIGIKLIWARGINWIRGAWFDWVIVVGSVMSTLVTTVVGLWATMGAGIAHAMVWIAGRIVEIINNLISRLPARIRNRLGVSTIGFDEAGLNETVDANAAGMRNTAQQAVDVRNAAAARAANLERERARLEEAGLYGELEYLTWTAAEAERVASIGRAARNTQDDEGSAGFDGKGSVVGTFSAMALGGMGGGSPLLEVNRQQRDLLTQVRDNILRIRGVNLA